LASIAVAPVPDNATDIATYIEEELEARIEPGRLTIGDPAIILEIEENLLQGSQGMFLWVALQPTVYVSWTPTRQSAWHWLICLQIYLPHSLESSGNQTTFVVKASSIGAVYFTLSLQPTIL
jgi:hypothetical protein